MQEKPTGHRSTNGQPGPVDQLLALEAPGMTIIAEWAALRSLQSARMGYPYLVTPCQAANLGNLTIRIPCDDH